MRESRIEQLVCRCLEASGYPTLKLGDQGWPDRIVFGRGRLAGKHVFVEFKTPTGSLTKAQLRRIPRLREQGEVVLVIDAVSNWIDITHQRWWGYTSKEVF